MLIYLPMFFMLTGCTNLFFYPLKQHLLDPAQAGVDYRDVYFSSSDGVQLHGWLLPAQTKRKATIVFFHGNAQNISTHVGVVYWLPQYGYEVFIVDYRGYGKSTGHTEIDGVISDVLRSIKFAYDEFQPAEPYIVMGQSLGASLSVYAVANSDYKNKIDGVVLIAPFSDYRKIVREYLGRSWITWLFKWPLSLTIDNDYSPLKYINKLDTMPVYILHSPQDEVIPIQNGIALFEKSSHHAKFVEIRGKHNDVFSIESNRRKLLEVLNSIVAVSGGS